MCDALEQYQSEVALAVEQGQILSAEEVQNNVAHCAAQLRDALSLIETEPVADAQGDFDPKTQRAVEVESVPRLRRTNRSCARCAPVGRWAATCCAPPMSSLGKRMSDSRFRMPDSD